MQLGYIWKTDFKEYLIKSQLRSCHPQSAVRRLGSKLCLSGAALRKLHRPPVCLQGPGGAFRFRGLHAAAGKTALDL